MHGPGGIKRHVFAPREPLLQIEMDGPGRGFRAQAVIPEPPPTALLGVRACDLAGLAVQDRIFLHDRFPDPHYAARRAGLLLVAVELHARGRHLLLRVDGNRAGAEPASYDVALTEMDDGFLVRAGSDAGQRPARRRSHSTRAGAAVARPRAGCASRPAPRSMQRSLTARNAARPALREPLPPALRRRRGALPLVRQLHDGLSHLLLSRRARRAVARRQPRASACATGTRASTREHAQVHGLNFRPHVRERYRQWLVHKLASWVDQFGASGCVGCGRCITWCPVGIDLTEEVAAIAATPGATS